MQTLINYKTANGSKNVRTLLYAQITIVLPNPVISVFYAEQIKSA